MLLLEACGMKENENELLSFVKEKKNLALRVLISEKFYSVCRVSRS